MEVRLQKFLAEAGIASRRKAEELIVMGKIQLNGKVVTELGTKVNTQKDVVLYQNKKVEINIKNMGVDIDKNEYKEIVLSNTNRPEMYFDIKKYKNNSI